MWPPYFLQSSTHSNITVLLGVLTCKKEKKLKHKKCKIKHWFGVCVLVHFCYCMQLEIAYCAIKKEWNAFLVISYEDLAVCEELVNLLFQVAAFVFDGHRS